nr:MAG TPA: hypothetical protein [Caudoviricetes sp.]
MHNTLISETIGAIRYRVRLFSVFIYSALLMYFLVSLFYLLELMGKSRFLTIIPIILVVRR